MPRRGYVSITIKRSTWFKLQELKKVLEVSTYDELVDNIHKLLIKGSSEEFIKKLNDIEKNIDNLGKEVVKIYELERLIDSMISELENLKIQLSKINAKIEAFEKRK